MECRPGCGACCVAPSIRGPIPGMPEGKPAGTPCVNLDPESYRCRIWGRPGYPTACRNFVPEPQVCGTDRNEALELITLMEEQTGS